MANKTFVEKVILDFASVDTGSSGSRAGKVMEQPQGWGREAAGSELFLVFSLTPSCQWDRRDKKSVQIFKHLLDGKSAVEREARTPGHAA